MNEPITIENDGQSIASANYWDLPHARRGLVFGSWNAGAIRLLIPDSMLAHVAEMRTGKIAMVTRGKLEGRDAIEIMFDDGSDSPFALHILREQTDRTLPASEDGRAITVSAWGRAGKLAQWPGRYRVGGRLPDMRPWEAK